MADPVVLLDLVVVSIRWSSMSCVYIFVINVTFIIIDGKLLTNDA
jgi:hypothetical protein